ncbi:3-isopropylmalate dehydratase large subunit [Patescibacteria group bacterium]|nr:3-isopropylmalate dehydratase large subunit [Patescibacteria group bacterium]
MRNTFRLTVSSIFFDHINTDDIIPGWTLQESTDRSFFGKYAFSVYDPDFITRCGMIEHNLIIAGKNFGAGSSREQAIYALQHNNVRVVIAQSFSEIFYRNALNNGLILIRFDNTRIFNMNDEVVLNLEDSQLIHNDIIHDFNIDTTDKKIFSMGGKANLVKDFLVDSVSKRRKRLDHYSKYKAKNNKSQTLVERIISSHIHRDVYAGERLDNIPVDVLFVNDAFGPAVIKEYEDNFTDVYRAHKTAPVVYDKSKVFFIVDHDSPPSSVTSSDGVEIMRDFSRKQNLKFYKPGDGIEHVVLAEDGYIVPGSFVVGTDSHTCTGGALNSLSFGIGTTEAAYVMATGHLHDFVVPETIRVDFSNKLQKGVYAKDIILYILSIVGVHGASKKIMEFGGSALKTLSIDARTTIANMVVETSARGAIFEYDSVTDSFIVDRAQYPYKEANLDEKCVYSSVIHVDLSSLEPCVAFPHKPDNVTFISKIEDYMLESQKQDDPNFPPVYDLKLTNGFLGACTNGKYEDFVEAAKIIKGRKIHDSVDFVVIPASRKIYQRLLSEGILKVFYDAGANIESSTCGPCYGKHKGLLSSSGVMISSSNRNFMGRMGSKEGKIFLASPLTVAASVIEGKITDPRRYL